MHWTHNLNPILVSLGPLKVHWYGLMYVIGFVLGAWLIRKLIEKNFFQVPRKRVDSLMTTLLLGMFMGARVAYVFIYNPSHYLQNPLEILFIWQGGLSFHGALVGLLIGGYIFAKRNNISWSQTMDVVALAGAPGLFFGRMGNFINGELFGMRTDSWVGVIFPAGGPLPRHPSQLYEGGLEGVVLPVILWFLLKKVRYYGLIASTFVIGYGIFRFFIEFFRQPDPQLGYFFGWLTMGQILCLLMILGGTLSLFRARGQRLLVSDKPS